MTPTLVVDPFRIFIPGASRRVSHGATERGREKMHDRRDVRDAS